MKKDTMVLKNGIVMELEAAASLGDVRTVFPDKDTFLAAWDSLTKENLAEVQVKNSAGLTVGAYTDLVLVSETSAVQEDGTILTSFCFREKDAMEKRMDAMEEGQTVQDGAIMDMAEMISTMAE